MISLKISFNEKNHIHSQRSYLTCTAHCHNLFVHDMPHFFCFLLLLLLFLIIKVNVVHCYRTVALVDYCLLWQMVHFWCVLYKRMHHKMRKIWTDRQTNVQYVRNYLLRLINASLSISESKCVCVCAVDKQIMQQLVHAPTSI